MYIPKIGDYSKLLTDDEVKDFAAINFSEYSKSSRGNELSEKQNLRKVAKWLYIFLITIDEVEIQSISYSLSWCNHIHLIILYITMILNFQSFWSRITTD